jgi:flagellar hook-associated protein 2
MSTSSVSGSGTVIDVQGIVNNLMQVEQRPLSVITDKIKAANVSISAMSDLKSMVDAAYAAAAAVEDPIMLSAKTINVSDTSIVKATVTSAADASRGSILVKSLRQAEAQKTKIVIPGAESSSSMLNPPGTGNLVIEIPANSTLLGDDELATGSGPIEFNLANQSLEDIRDAINGDERLQGKVRADLVNTGVGSEPWVLVLTGSKTGASAGFTSTYMGTPITTSAGSSGQVIQAPLAALAQVGGVEVQSETNVFENAMPGVRIELLKARIMSGVDGGTDLTSTLAVGDNKAAITAKVQTLATAFTNLVLKIRSLSKSGTPDSKAGPLASNSGVLSLSSSVMAAYSQGFRVNVPGVWQESDGTLIGRTVYEAGESYTQLSWAHLGMELGRDGSISVDSSRLAAALEGKVGLAIAGGFGSSLKSVLNSFRGISGSMQSVLDSMRTNVSNLQSDQTKSQQRIDRLRSSYLAKYSALDAKLVQMRQTSSSVQSALAGLRA